MKYSTLILRSSILMTSLLMSFIVLIFSATNIVAASSTAEIRVVNPLTSDGNFTFYIGSPPGRRFNVTVWIYNVKNLFSFQFLLKVDDDLFNITRAWLPTTDEKYIFYGKRSVALSPTFYDNDNDGALDGVLVGDSLLGSDNKTGSGLLGIVELKILVVPSAPTISTLNINNEDTFILDPSLGDIRATITDGKCSFIKDSAPPTIGVPQQIPPPNEVPPKQAVTVKVGIIDIETGVKNATLYYTNNTIWYAVPMGFNVTSGLWEGIIPGFIANTRVKYKIEAYDNAGNKAMNDNAGEYFVYIVIPEFRSTLTVMLTSLSGTIAITLTKKQKRKS